ncbi:MAG TPA: DUF929 family protein [Ktedonobacteraceae bacterium]|nr:DUF929 family protein [Ktedonobacteraceae bacterium]
MAKGKQQSAAQRREKQRQQRSQRLGGAQNRVQSTTSASRRGPTVRRHSWNQSYMVGVVLLLLVGIVVAFVIISHTQSSAPAPTLASSQVFNDVTKVDTNILAAVGTGSVQNPFKAVQGSPLPPVLNGPTGKPEVLYMGAEYCPYCAAQRWAIVVALSRFGSFSQLYQTTSSSTDSFPSTPTFTFYPKLYKGPLYTSQYIDFVPVEETGNVADSSGSYPILQTPTAQQLQLFSKYDAPPYIDASNAGSIPFIDVANKFVSIGLGQGFSPQDLANMQWSNIASSLVDTSSTVSQHILGSANYLIASICIATGQQPASVCSTAAMQKIEQTLNKTANGVNNTQVALNVTLEADLRRSLW